MFISKTGLDQRIKKIRNLEKLRVKVDEAIDQLN